MTSDDSLNSELLAEEFVTSISDAREQLKEGAVKECLSILTETENKMKIVLALIERDCSKEGLVSVH